MRGRVHWLAAMAAMLLLGSGCIVNVGTTKRPYETCSPSTDTCSGVSTCQQANLSTGGSAGFQCTANCGASCPTDAFGNLAFCYMGQCYQGCATGTGCNAGFTCATPTGATQALCVPDGGTPACGGIGQPCCAGNTCSAAGAVCGAGTCRTACGGIGEACCAGNTCNAGSCQSGTCQNVTAPPSAYEGCTPIGAACGTGTTCQRPMIANPGATGWCTLACTNAATMCPSLPGSITDCYILQGATNGQCYVACPNGTETCPTGTTCLMTDTMTATGVRLCMPPAT